MKMKFQLILSSMMCLLFSACNVSNKAPGNVAAEEITKFGDDVDSIKVEVSTKVGGTRGIILRGDADAVARFENRADSVLSSPTSVTLGYMGIKR